MAKANIHPTMKKIEVNFPNGKVFETESATHKAKIYADIYFKDHPAWNDKSNVIITSNTQVEKFMKKFGNLGGLFGGETTSE